MAPAVSRADKPKIRSQNFANHTPAPSESALDIRRSPFGSPPSSSESQGEDLPPSLPSRPRIPRQQLQQVDRAAALPPRPPQSKPATTTILQFDPPPIHPSSVRASVSIQPVGAKPPLPTRPQSISAQPPSRATRPSVNTTAAVLAGGKNLIPQTPATPSLSSSSQKRVASNPTGSSQTYPAPPTRTRHGRAMTIDRTSKAAMDDVRAASMAVAGSGLTVGGPASAIASQDNDYSTLMSPSTRPAESPISGGSGNNIIAGFPDATNVNRRAPYAKHGVAEINTRYECRVFDVCGELICTTGYLTRVWSVTDGELLMSLSHGENIKATAVAFRPGVHVDDEGTRLWIGNAAGELMEADIASQSIVCLKQGAHARHEVIKIHRHYNELWTLDDGGSLYVWGPTDDAGVPSLAGIQDQSYRVPRGHTFSIVVGDELWHATGKEIRVFLPTLDGRGQFQVLNRALCQDGAGEITSGTTAVADMSRVFFGHVDGKVSMYSRQDHSCLGVVSLGSYKINTMASAGEYVWAGFNTGRMCVYDSSSSPWIVRKEWQAHDSPVLSLLADRSSAYRTGQVQVASLGADNTLRLWDGLLQEDWLEEAMQGRDSKYCAFDTLGGQIMTWNAGASTPNSLRYAESDSRFMQDLLENSGSPEILVFGFQELVDLEDKTATAKRFLKPKKKEGSDQERMSHQYRDWRDFLVRSLDDHMAGELYHLLQTAHMVGLFTCVFVKADLRARIHGLATTEVKRGMGGLHGNKGALVVRFMVDDTSLCLVNCHLAAGQSQAAHRHNDVAAILETAALPSERDAATRIDTFVGGGDGSMILDHELCVLNGDLNYRIDTMSRDTVVAAVRAGNLAKLLERDQLLVARRRNAGFRLRSFEELPIGFAPTYKYDVGTDTYDSSEKKRSPAWCDRLLFRGGRAGRVRQLDYRRHEVRVSDHRPVTGRFEFTVKRIDPRQRAAVWIECQKEFEGYMDAVVDQERMYYLTHVIGYDEATSRRVIEQRVAHWTRLVPGASENHE